MSRTLPNKWACLGLRITNWSPYCTISGSHRTFLGEYCAISGFLCRTLSTYENIMQSMPWFMLSCKARTWYWRSLGGLWDTGENDFMLIWEYLQTFLYLPSWIMHGRSQCHLASRKWLMIFENCYDLCAILWSETRQFVLVCQVVSWIQLQEKNK